MLSTHPAHLRLRSGHMTVLWPWSCFKLPQRMHSLMYDTVFPLAVVWDAKEKEVEQKASSSWFCTRRNEFSPLGKMKCSKRVELSLGSRLSCFRFALEVNKLHVHDKLKNISESTPSRSRQLAG